MDSTLPTDCGAKPVISSEYVHPRAEDLDSSAVLHKPIAHEGSSGLLQAIQDCGTEY